MKLPARTEPEIAALPDGVFAAADGRRFSKLDGEFMSLDCHMEMCDYDVVDAGGITARLVDSAPLEALLREANGALAGMVAITRRDASASQIDVVRQLRKRIEAALEGNDG